jgi:dihydropteroate synthase
MSQDKIIFRSAEHLFAIDSPAIMGIVNVTPDSFYPSSRKQTPAELIDSVGRMIEDGASILDIGAVSTRPGSTPPSEMEELDRLIPALITIKQSFPDVIISVDTFRSNVARSALKSGAHIINDISAGNFEPDILSICAEYSTPFIIMHMQGVPLTMQTNPLYHNVLEEVFDFISAKIQQCISAGINDIWIDPGFGFGKALDHNYTLLKQLEIFKIHKRPVVVGLSRKGMIYKLLQIRPEDSLSATSALHLQVLMNGADILRVHDVREAAQIIKLFHKLKEQTFVK